MEGIVRRRKEKEKENERSCNEMEG